MPCAKSLQFVANLCVKTLLTKLTLLSVPICMLSDNIYIHMKPVNQASCLNRKINKIQFQI